MNKDEEFAYRFEILYPNDNAESTTAFVASDNIMTIAHKTAKDVWLQSINDWVPNLWNGKYKGHNEYDFIMDLPADAIADFESLRAKIYWLVEELMHHPYQSLLSVEK